MDRLVKFYNKKRKKEKRNNRLKRNELRFIFLLALLRNFSFCFLNEV